MDYRNSTAEELQAEIEAIEAELAKRQEIDNIPRYIAGQVNRWKELCPDDPGGWAAEIVEGGDDETS